MRLLIWDMLGSRQGRAGLVCCAWMAAACGAAESAPVAPLPSASATAAPTAAPLPPHTIARSAVKATLAQGLGFFLQRVDLDDQPVRVGGKFHGFRIAALHGPGFWSGVDLKPGDVVVSVNGLPIERPEQAKAAFDGLASATELRVSYERDGETRELVYPIVDDSR